MTKITEDLYLESEIEGYRFRSKPIDKTKNQVSLWDIIYVSPDGENVGLLDWSGDEPAYLPLKNLAKVYAFLKENS